MEITCTFGENIKKPEEIFPIKLEDVFLFMRLSEKLQYQIEDYRKTRDKEIKLSLPYMVTSHFREKRAVESFEKSNAMIFDVDHVADLESLFEKLKQNERIIYAIFRSPSGDGLKFIVPFSTMINDNEVYSYNYSMLKEKFENKYGIQLDKTSDCSRACFLSYDEKMFINENCFPVSLVQKPKPQKYVPKTNYQDLPYEGKKDKSIDELVQIASLMPTLSDYSEWIKAGMALKTLGDGAFEVFKALSLNRGYKDTERNLWSRWRSFPDTGKVTIATFYHLCKKYNCL